jgi:MFS family permease
MNTKSALLFVILIGVVSFFADMTYEGARSATGQYLSLLGASGTIVGIVAGFGEFIGYGFRAISGYISDKTGRYWFITFIGYMCNLIAVPFLALANSWQMASFLIILERFGKAVRTPSRDAMLSYATKEMGRGWGFGLHEAMDQAGALIGPLLVSLVLFAKSSYQSAFAILSLPALCAMSALTYARISFPKPQELEVEYPHLQEEHFTKKYWLYVAAIACLAAGYMDFALIAFHLKKDLLFSDAGIPLMFSIAMGVAGLSALLFGPLYDKFGLSVLIFATSLTAFFAPLIFMNKFYSIIAGLLLWGIGLGAQGSIMRAFVAHLVQKNRRGTAYGMMNFWFGLAWFLGSALMGVLYDISFLALLLFSCGMQLAAIPLLFAVKKMT